MILVASQVLLILLWSSYILSHRISRHINKQIAFCRWKRCGWAASIHRSHDPILTHRHTVPHIGKAHCSKVWDIESHSEEGNNKTPYFTIANRNDLGCLSRYTCISQKCKRIPGVTTVKAAAFLYRRILLGSFCSHRCSVSLFPVGSFLSRQYWNSYSLYLSPMPICFLGSMDLGGVFGIGKVGSLRSHPHRQKSSASSHNPPLLPVPQFYLLVWY